MEKALRIQHPFFVWKRIKSLFSVVSYSDGYRFINRFKLLLVTIFCIFFLTCFFNYFSGLEYSYAITLIGSVGVIGFGYLIKRYQHWSVRIAFFIFLNFAAFSLNYVEGTSSGAYFFYFLVIVIVSFVSSKENTRELIVIYFFTFIMLAGTFWVCPKDSTLQSIEKDMRDMNLYMNGFISFFIGGILSYYMMKDSFLKESILVSKQNFLDSIYNSSLDAVLIIDVSTGLVTDCNQQSLQIFDMKRREDIVGKTAFSFFASTDSEKTILIHKLLDTTDLSWKGELDCITGTDRIFAGYVSAVQLVHDGMLLRKINILDITDIKEARVALEFAKEKAEQSVAARTKFLSNMSHELRTPLNGIIGSTNLLLQDSYTEGQRQYFNVLKYSSEHMLSLINDILDFSKIEAGKMDLEKTTFNLRKLVDNICQLFDKQLAQKNVKLRLEFDKTLDNNYIGDQTRLGQVITNLVSNAAKFTSEGEVVVSLKKVAQNSNACTISFFVQDSGIGIPEEKQQQIFESFMQVDTATTRKFGGTGLGLSISAKIVELFGGKLKVESMAGEGSRFYFNIQLGIDHQQSPYVNEEAVKELRSLSGMRILIAEDNPINMLIARTTLQRWGIETTEAVNGRIGLEKYREGSFDLLLIDLEMPEMDGFELLAAVREDNPDIPVIAFTAAVYENMQAHLINKGFTDYVQKPFRPEELHVKLSRFQPKASQ